MPGLLAALSAWTASTLAHLDRHVEAGGVLECGRLHRYRHNIVVLTVVATVPFRPWHTLALGFAIEGMYILSCWFAAKWEVSTVPVNSDVSSYFPGDAGHAGHGNFRD